MMLTLLLPLLSACGPDIRSLYEEERKHALTIEADAPRDWQPDLVVGLGEEALGEAVQTFMNAALSEEAGNLKVDLPLGALAKLKPKLKAQKVSLSPGNGCDSCLHFETTIKGDVEWALGGLGGEFPGRVSVAGQLQVVVENRTQISLKPFKIGKVDFESTDLGGLRVNPASPIQDYIRAILGERLPPIPLGDLGAAKLPIRLLRVRMGSQTVRLEVLTDVPGGRAATVPDPAPGALILGISETALSGLLRREAFTKGPVAMDVAVDPRAVDVEGTAFHLDLRLWRLVGSGWWRDYDASGTLSIEGGKLRLHPNGVKEVAVSPGAELVDPLAALAQSQILDAITDNLAQTLPASEPTKLGGVSLRAVTTGVRGVGDTLLLDAELRFPGKGR